MNTPNPGQIHDLKKKLRILNAELDKMQSDPQHEAEHFAEAYKISKWVNNELDELFPVNRGEHYNFEFKSGVLVDDYPIYGDNWNHDGLQYGKHVTQYLSAQSFLSDLERHDRATFLYIDWYLTPLKNSYDFIKYLGHDLKDQKFHNIIITTDETELNLSEMPWVKAIIRKDPPWSLGLTLNKDTR